MRPSNSRLVTIPRIRKDLKKESEMLSAVSPMIKVMSHGREPVSKGSSQITICHREESAQLGSISDPLLNNSTSVILKSGSVTLNLTKQSMRISKMHRAC